MPNGRDLNMTMESGQGPDINMNLQTGGNGAAKTAEAYAVGTRGGVAVGPDDPAYNNYAKYWAQQAAASATDATKYPKIVNNKWQVWNPTTQQYVDTGIYINWHIVKTYASIAEMNADYSGTDTAVGDYVMIVESGVESADNAKVYIKGSSAWEFVVDMSGATGIQGPIGVTPQFSIGTVEGLSHGADPTASVDNTDPEHPVLNLGIPAGASGNETIDDTAGENDDDKVWSADKLTKEFKGVHTDLFSGCAQQTLSGETISDNEPYLFRQSKNGIRVDETLIGGTVVWNQLIKDDGTDITVSSTVTKTVADGEIKIVSSTDTASIKRGSFTSVNTKDHVYLFSCQIKNDGNTTGSFGFYNISSNANLSTISSTGSSYIKGVNIYKPTVDFFFALRVNNLAQNGGYIVAKEIQLFDLTQMFGSTIADAIYAMEQETAGSGIAYLKKCGFFTKDYYAYDAGSLQSVQASGKKTTGKNFANALSEGNWYFATNATARSKSLAGNTISINGDTVSLSRNSANYGYACLLGKLMPNTQYVLSLNWVNNPSSLYVEYVKESDIGNSFNVAERIATSNTGATSISFTTPSVTEGLVFEVLIWIANADNINAKNIQLEFGSEKTAYERYIVNTYPFDSSLTLRGIPKWENSELKYDGDVYEADGTVTRKYGIVDLGTLEWMYNTNLSTPSFSISASSVGIKQNTANIIVPGYKYKYNYYNSTGNDKCFDCGMNFVISNLAYTDVATFKTAMSGVYLVYELATPTTESADAFATKMIFSPDGTEEFIDAAVTASTPTRDVAIPVGHESVYHESLRSYVDRKIAEVAALVVS